MLVKIVDSIKALNAEAWNALWISQYPFVRHEFLCALEDSGSTNSGDFSSDDQHAQDSGWHPKHVTVWLDDALIAALPLFEKSHSYGEYVFDWAWADAYSQQGLDYYPKLLNAIPFTPATGSRLGLAKSLDEATRSQVTALIFEFVHKFARDEGYSGFHSLFPDGQGRKYLKQSKHYQRDGYQFHWFNQGYTSFDDFLSHFSSRKRKAIKKERRKVHEQDIDISMRLARDISADEWQTFYMLYHTTYLKRSGKAGYLGQSFFQRLAKAFPEQVLLSCAHHQGQLIAAALYLRDETTLYGRYWGCRTEIDGLHFEACYYQGVEYAIAEGIQRFDPGAQGEHKIQRGFTPIRTCSYHWLRHPGFNHAIADFVKREAVEVSRYIEDARTYLPFKEGTQLIAEDELLLNSNEGCQQDLSHDTE
ncbi:MAG: GNAT family N-acetyltransferase [Alteromonadaceae bacterium]|nr:MAG: GNAT family N-acetyltransferase [Alteromonadaceae bacterium]